MGRTNNDRLYLRLPSELKKEMEDYASRNNTTLSALTIRFFTKLLQEEKRLREPVDAEQI